MKRKVLFVINPASGLSAKRNLPANLGKYLIESALDYTVVFTRYRGHARQISEQAVQDGYDAVIAVGGDGTVSEVASGVVNSSVAIGIIPMGSGNGLANHLKIPRDLKKNLALLNAFNLRSIDTFTVNGSFGCNLAGIGFDGKVAKLFDNNQGRGLFRYAQIILHEFLRYKEGQFRVHADGLEVEKRAFFICAANSAQFGNGAEIAPHAIMDDGFLDICICKKVPLIKSPVWAMMLMTRRVNQSRYVEYFKAKELIINAQKSTPFHIDGDYMEDACQLEIKVNPKSLKVLVP